MPKLAASLHVILYHIPAIGSCDALWTVHVHLLLFMHKCVCTIIIVMCAYSNVHLYYIVALCVGVSKVSHVL